MLVRIRNDRPEGVNHPRPPMSGPPPLDPENLPVALQPPKNPAVVRRIGRRKVEGSEES